MAASRPVTPDSSKLYTVKPQEPGVPMFGCEHLQLFLSKTPETTSTCISRYKMLLRVVFDKSPIIRQTSKSPNGTAVTSLTPNYLCLQCSTTTTLKERAEHGKQSAHRFYVESQSGCLFCGMCDDFVWDPTLESLRLQKYGTGTFSTRKRKHDELFTTAFKEDVSTKPLFQKSTLTPPCRVSGLRGIYNMGATCFMSVILQSFIHNPLLRNFYLSDGHTSSDCERKHCLNCALDSMFQDFYAQDKTTPYSAADFLTSSWMSRTGAFTNLAGYEQQDAHEFFQFLTEELHRTNAAIRATADDSDASESPIRTNGNGVASQSCSCVIHQTFYGKLQSTVTCQNCGGITTAVEPFLDLSLGLEGLAKKRKLSNNSKKPAVMTLEGCLDEEYTRAEKFEYKCSKCNGARDAKKQLSIYRLPNVLCVQFKRFEHHKETQNTTKINVKVQFPLQINMLPYTTRARNMSGDSEAGIGITDHFELARSCTYDLVSVVVHAGTIDTGHYTSFSRSGNQWFKFDDHKVTLASESQVLGAEAFLLFYIIRSLT